MLSSVIRYVVCLGLNLTFSYAVWGQSEAGAQTNEVSFNSEDHLRIQGFHGDIEFKILDIPKIKVVSKWRVTQTSSSEEPSSELSQDWSLELKKEGHLVLIKVKGPLETGLWVEPLRSQSLPQLQMTIYMPLAPVEIFWRKGNIQFSQWSKNIKIHLLEGDIKILGGEGAAQIVHHKGQLQVQTRKGALKIESYFNNINVSEHDGNVQIKNFEGKTILEKIKGEINVTQNKGRLFIEEGEGEIEFKNKSAQTKITQFSGGIRGRTHSGSIFVDLEGEVKLNIKTQLGGVRLKLKNSGSYMNLGTKEGSFFTPSYLKITRYATIKVIKGRLRGRESGRIFVRTDSGNIQIL